MLKQEIIINQIFDKDENCTGCWIKGKDDNIIASIRIDKLYYWLIGHLNQKESDLFYFYWDEPRLAYLRSKDETVLAGSLWVDTIIVQLNLPTAVQGANPTEVFQNAKNSPDFDPRLKFSVRDGRLAMETFDLDLIGTTEANRFQVNARNALKKFLKKIPQGARKGNQNRKGTGTVTPDILKKYDQSSNVKNFSKSEFCSTNLIDKRALERALKKR